MHAHVHIRALSLSILDRERDSKGINNDWRELKYKKRTMKIALE